VNPSHPDKVADRIAGAIVDLCYTKSRNPKVACEVLIGHGECNIQVETSERISAEDIEAIVSRIAGEGIETRALIVPQDIHLAANQQHGVKCGDNGIFRGVPPTHEQKLLTAIAASIYDRLPFDGKYIINHHICEEDAKIKKWLFGRPPRVEWDVTVCQSHLSKGEEEHKLLQMLVDDYGIDGWKLINPLGEWTGGTDVDTGATNRKLGSDMGDAVTGGGLHGKDLSKADVSVNIYLHQLAQRRDRKIALTWCAIGDDVIISEGDQLHHEETRFSDVIEIAREYVKSIGGFEKLAEWGLIRP
jgi:S-adenosylmethionine synthetase